MASHRNAASSTSSAEGRPSADALPVEEAPPAKDKTASDSTPPRAGRTGNLGSRAERPAENRAHKSGNEGVEPTRKGKAPSPAARDGERGDPDQPRAMRDPAN